MADSVSTDDKEYNVLMDAARSHMNAAQAYFEAAREMMMNTVGVDKESNV